MSNKRVKQQIVTTPKFWWLLVGAMFIVSIAIRRNVELTNQSVAPVSTTVASEWKKVAGTSAIFYSKIFQQRDKTFVYIPIKFEGETQVSRLSLNSSGSAEPNIWIMTHPTLEKINWSAINKGSIYLYQKKKIYNTMEDFLNNPPTADKIYIERAIKNFPPYTTMQGNDLPDSFDPNAVDFVLTTYKHFPQKDGGIYYENTVDASSGMLNSNDKLMWIIEVLTTTPENPFYIGEIHIDYN